MRTILIAIAAPVLLTSSSASAEVIHACVKNDGSLRIVSFASDCKKNETPISWNQAGPKGDQGEKGDAGPPGPEGDAAPELLVVDGNGVELGVLVDWFTRGNSTDPHAVFYVEAIDLTVRVARLTGLTDAPLNVFFETPNCLEQAYLPRSLKSHLEPHAVLRRQ